jgi:hypothetical protein
MSTKPTEKAFVKDRRLHFNGKSYEITSGWGKPGRDQSEYQIQFKNPATSGTTFILICTDWAEEPDKVILNNARLIAKVD